ncbi:MAG TPA: hypothetical protein VFG01_00350, partial [Acidobacteriota bacterium]|nr:hypothetical protein [Acidobacteriota bacterium]
EKRRRMALKIFSEHKPYLNFRSARLNGKKMAIKIKNINRKKDSIIIFEKLLQVVEDKIIIGISSFIYE